MLLAFFGFTDHIVWRLRASDPQLFPLSGTDEWLLVNPLLYPQLPVQGGDRNPIMEVDTEKYLWVDSEIVLATRENRPSQPVIIKFEDLVPVVEELLVKLRHISGQATLPNMASFAVGGNIDLGKLPELAVESSLPGDRYGPGLKPYGLGRHKVSKYMWTTAVTAELINEASRLGPSFTPPTREVLFLDAIAAYRANDHRRAILYSAISAEVAFGSVIDEAYDRALAVQNDERFRVVSLSQAGGATIRKDPVYEKLRQRSDFNTLLHELSLYVLRRSLLTENQVLFGSAKRLYSTRNQLVHSGELEESDSNSTYPLDAHGAMAALRTVIGLFSWLGIRDNFPLPQTEFVSYPSEATW